jgi:hypothetical protein
MTEQTGLVGGDGEGRDVVQRRGQRQYRPRQLAGLSGFLQKVQRNGLTDGEGPGAGTPEIGDVPDGPKRMSDVASERADIRALRDGRGDGDFSQFILSVAKRWGGGRPKA